MVSETNGSAPTRPLIAAIRSWRGGGGAVPTTRAGAEIAVMITIVGWRVGTLVQIIPAISRGAEDSHRPALYLFMVSIVLIESVGLCWFSITTRGFRSTRWSIIDVSVAAVALLMQPLYVADGDLIGTWSAWAPGLAINAGVVASLGLGRRRHIAVAAALLAACYLAVSWPAAETDTQLATVRSNALSYPVFIAMARAMGGFVRRFGAAADDARAKAIEAARIAERERHRRMLHDQVSLLRLLANPAVDPLLAAPLREQALAESNRLRLFLDVEPQIMPTSDDGSALLVDVVVGVAVEFSDLPISLMLDLGTDVRLPIRSVEPVRSAVATVLSNARLHGTGLTSVVIHTDAGMAGEWELTIRDDGCGFDPLTTPPGFGLKKVVGEGLATVGVHATVVSEPGQGTTVTMAARG